MSEDQNQPQTESTELKPVEVFFPDELKKVVYSNNVFINHTSEEIVLDFINVIPPVGSVVARVALNLPTQSVWQMHSLKICKNMKRFMVKFQ